MSAPPGPKDNARTMPFNDIPPAGKTTGRKGFLLGATAGVGLAGALALSVGATLSHAQNAPPSQAQNAPAKMAAAPPRFGPAPGAPQTFADIFERVAPAVVSINVTAKVTQAELGEMQGAIPFPFNQLPQFRTPNGGGTGRTAPGARGKRGPTPDGDGAEKDDLPEAQAAGSGFFISKDGYIVTNNHVVENATKITVVLSDKREFPATVVGRDEDSDIAVVKVAGANFPFVDFENQAKPRVGDWVLAIGNPLQLGGTATAGIVSAIARDLPPDGNPGALPAEYLQIDAPINRGNSGGPTFDIYGRVVGVNTAIYSQTGGSIGIGFAVPADTAESVVKELIAGRTISRGYLGASIQAMPSETAESLGIPVNSGALVADVTAGGPGSKAGLQAGDIVLGINGRKISGSTELTREVARTHVGEPMRLEIRRGGRVQILTVTAGRRPSAAVLNRGVGGEDDTGTGAGAAGKPEVSHPSVLGLEVTPLDAAGRRDNSIAADVRGLLVESVAPTSDAAKKGVRKGMVIVQANEHPVATAQDFAAAVAEARKAGRPAVFLLINQAGRNAGVPIKLDAPAPAK